MPGYISMANKFQENIWKCGNVYHGLKTWYFTSYKIVMEVSENQPSFYGKNIILACRWRIDTVRRKIYCLYLNNILQDMCDILQLNIAKILLFKYRENRTQAKRYFSPLSTGWETSYTSRTFSYHLQNFRESIFSICSVSLWYSTNFVFLMTITLINLILLKCYW